MKIKLWFLLLFLILGGSASFAQDAYYSEVAVAPNPWVRNGGLLPSANTAVRICTFSASPTVPCTGLATIWDSSGNIVSSALYQSFGQISTDMLGRFTFGCVAGKYTLQIQSTTNNSVLVNKPISCGGAGGNGLSDPGSNGVLFRSAFNTTALATYNNIANLWASGTCSGFLKSDGTCVFIVPVVNGGTGTSTPSLIAGTNISISGSWPNQTITSSGGGGGMADPGANGVMKRTALNTSAAATFADVVSLWSTCTGFLKNDGTCAAAGVGTVTVVGAGNLGASALVTGGGTQTLQTPSLTSTLDSSGNMNLPGALATGVGSGVGGSLGVTQGTAPSIVANTVSFVAPTSVTGYNFVLPSAAASGIPHFTNVAGVVTWTIGAIDLSTTDATGTLAAARMPALTGDVTSTVGTVATTLATVNGSPGACGDATHVCAVTTNGKGLVTSQTATAISASGSSVCTDTLTPGAQAITYTAGHTYCATTGGNYTFAALSTISVNDVTILCTNTAAILKRTGTTGLFSVSGSRVTIANCTLDGNSQTAAGTAALIAISGDFAVVSNNIFQNEGLTNPTTGTIYQTAGKGVQITNNRILSTTDKGISIIPAAATTINDTSVTENYVDLTSGASSFAAIYSSDSINSGNVVNLSIQNNTVKVGSTGSVVNGVEVVNNIAQTSLSLGLKINNNHCSATASIKACYKAFGVFSGAITGNTALDNGFVTGDSMYWLGDIYNTAIAGNSGKQTSNVGTSCLHAIDFGRLAVNGNTCHGGNGTATFFFENVANVGSDSQITGNVAQIDAATAGIGFYLVCNDVSHACNDNSFIGNHVVGDGTAGQVGIKIQNLNGGIAGTQIAFNQITNVPTGILTTSGTGTVVGPNTYDTVTTPISDAATATVNAPLLQRAVITSAYTNSTTTPSNVTGLSFTLAKNSTYFLNCALVYKAASTGGLKILFTGPASPSLVTYSLTEGLSATTTGNTSTTGTVYSTVLGAAVTTATTDFPGEVTGVITTGSTAGTLQLQAQSAAAATLTIEAGSACTLQ
jgi:hypothetical protein